MSIATKITFHTHTYMKWHENRIRCQAKGKMKNLRQKRHQQKEQKKNCFKMLQNQFMKCKKL